MPEEKEPDQAEETPAEMPSDEPGGEATPSSEADTVALPSGARSPRGRAASAYQKAQEGQAPAEPAEAEEDYKALAQRTAADFDNYRKRVAREKREWKRQALADFLREFLPAFDDLDRAIAEGEKHDSYEVLHEGVKLVRGNLWKAMHREGVDEIPALGQKFDPRLHEAMTAVPTDAHEPNTVIEVFQAGYRVDEFVIRPSKVVVSAAPVATSAEADNPAEKDEEAKKD